MARHGSSEMERRGVALLQADESGTGTLGENREAHPGPSNGRPPRLPTLGLEPGRCRSRKTSFFNTSSVLDWAWAEDH